MAINSVNNNSIPFGDRQRESGGILFPAVGGAVVGGAGTLIVQGRRKPNLEGVTKDTFSKAMTEVEGLSDEQKKAVKVVQEYLGKQPVEEIKPDAEAEPKTDKKAEAKAEAPKGKTTRPSVAAEGVTIENIFGKSEELEPLTYIQEKYGRTPQGLIDEIKAKKAILNGQDGKALRVGVRVAEHEQHVTEAGIAKAKQLLDQLTRGEALKIKIKEAEFARDEITDITSRAFANAQSKVDALNKNLEKQEETIKKAEGELRTNKVGAELAESIDAGLNADTAFVERSANGATNIGKKAYKDFSARIQKEAETAANKEIARIEKESAKVAQAKGEKYVPMTNEAKEEFIAKAKKEALTVNQERIKAYVDIEVDKELHRRYSAELNERVAHAQKKTLQTSFKELKGNKRELESLKASVSEMEQDLTLVRKARKDGTKITKAQAEEVLGTANSKLKAGSVIKDAAKDAKSKVGETAGKVTEEAKGKLPAGIEEALKSLKGKLPQELTKFNTKGLVCGGLIGLAAGVILKWIFGGKSEE